MLSASVHHEIYRLAPYLHTDHGLLGAEEERVLLALILDLLNACNPHKVLFPFCHSESGLELWVLISPVSLLATEGALIFL
jgi:hypothetical protein